MSELGTAIIKINCAIAMALFRGNNDNAIQASIRATQYVAEKGDGAHQKERRATCAHEGGLTRLL